MASRNGRRYVKDEDFEEEEVWGVMEERENSSPKHKKPFKNSSHSKHFTTATPRMIPRSSSSSSPSSLMGGSEKQSSAPVEIPDWSKIYGKTSKKNKNGVSTSSWVDYNSVNHDGYYNANGGGYDDVDHHHHLNGYHDDGDRDDDDDDDDMVPPHEFLAKKLARSQISSFSVYEGIGRTLKGRDLSKVRNAILTRTGFLE
ncbi:Fascin [Bienertia sinuspersici]